MIFVCKGSLKRLKALTACFLLALASLYVAYSHPAYASADAGQVTPSVTIPQSVSPTDAQKLDAWRKSAAQTRSATPGCFTFKYPSLIRHSVPCSSYVPPPVGRPLLPRPRSGGITPFGTAALPDYVTTASGTIKKATGSFWTASNPSGEKDNNTPPVSNSYSLQIDTNQSVSNTTVTSLCKNAKTPSGCIGWQQFVYQSNGELFMQYWLLNYGNTNCPTKPNIFKSAPISSKNPTTGAITTVLDCVLLRSPKGTLTVPVVQANNLLTTSLEADASSTGDSVIIYIDGDAYELDDVSILGLAPNWTQVEFNVFGPNSSLAANFAGLATFGVYVYFDDGTTKAPASSSGSTTAESSNLNLSPACNGASPPSAIFQETTGTASASCGPPIGCTFTTSCPAISSSRLANTASPSSTFSVPPNYTMTCPSPVDFYSWSGPPVEYQWASPNGLNLLQAGVASNTGSTTDVDNYVAACVLGTKNQCYSFSVDTIGHWCTINNPPPPACTHQCPGGERCCVNPDGTRNLPICVSDRLPCPAPE